LEAIFEIRWQLETDEQNTRMRDPSYPMMYGRLYERMKKDFPLTEDLPSVQAHPETTPYVLRHRIRKEKNGYPLIQVGPGIVTLNHSKGYSWTEFKALALRMVESVVELYPSEAPLLNFIKAELRFVNGIRFDLARENPLAFLEEKLHMKVEMSPEFNEQNILSERPNAFGLNLAYALEKPMGNLAISANLGQFDNKPAFIQQCVIHSFGELVPTDVSNFTPWLDEAHAVGISCFQIFCKGELIDRFCGA
jgi:uncharacterized protein (TIGR04255 family)